MTLQIEIVEVEVIYLSMYEKSLLLLEEKQKHLNPNNYNLVYMGDSWVGNNGYTSNEIFKDAMEEAKKYNPLFILHGGDLVFNGEKENFNFFINTKNDVAPDLPLFVAIGNHDMVKQNTGDTAVANFKDIVGPLHFTLNIPAYNLTLIGLDSLYHHEYSNYGLTEDELDYLMNNLQHRHRNTFVAMHVPPVTDTWVPEPEDDTFFTRGSKAFFREVHGKISAALLSHIHAFKYTEYKCTNLYLSGGGGAALLKNEIFHILVINIRNHHGNNKISFEVIPIGRD
jgi:Icc protein